MELKRLRAGKETKNRQTSERTGARTDKSDDKLHKRARKEERKSDGEGEKAMNHQQHDIEAEVILLREKPAGSLGFDAEEGGGVLKAEALDFRDHGRRSKTGQGAFKFRGKWMAEGEGQ